jgi:transposase
MCGMERDLNACINIAHRVMSSMGWGSPKLADVAGGVKPPGEL